MVSLPYNPQQGNLSLYLVFPLSFASVERMAMAGIIIEALDLVLCSIYRSASGAERVARSIRRKEASLLKMLVLLNGRPQNCSPPKLHMCQSMNSSGRTLRRRVHNVRMVGVHGGIANAYCFCLHRLDKRLFLPTQPFFFELFYPCFHLGCCHRSVIHCVAGITFSLPGKTSSILSGTRLNGSFGSLNK